VLTKAPPPTRQQLRTDNEDLRARLEKAEEALREILSGEGDALFVRGAGGTQLYALKGADQSYRTLIENMGEGALTLTAEGMIVYANRRFAEMLGTPLEKVIGSEIHAWIAPGSRRALLALMRKDARGNRREELVLSAAGGKRVPVYLSVNRLLLDGLPDSLCMVATDLAEQKRNEAILAEERLARAILEQSADAIVICDATGRIIRASRQAQAFFDHALLGQRFERVFPLRQPDGTPLPPVGAIGTSPGQTVEASLEREGKGIDFLVSVGHLKGAGGELIGSVATLTDITERQRADEALRASETEFRTLAESMPQLVWVARADGWNTYVNQQWMDYTGLTNEESLGDGWNAPFHPDDRQRAWDAWQKAVNASGTYSLECRLRRADGVYRWWLVRGVPLKDASGGILKWFGTGTDIHDLKMAELDVFRANAELRESERRFTDLLDNVELVSVMLDREGRITYCNEYLLQLTGWQDKDVTGRNWVELFVPSELAEDKRGFYAELLLDRPHARHHESEILTRSGGRRLIHWNNSVLRSGPGDVIGTASIGEDITEQKRAEVRIRRLNRVNAVLSDINTLIVRVRSRDELFREACRIAVEAGAFRMAWIGVINPQTLDGEVVAWYGGDQGYVDMVRFTVREGAPDSDRPASRALRNAQPVISSDLMTDTSVIPLREELSKRGHKSAACFPLTVDGRTEAVIALFAGEVGFFDEEEVKLLRELAGNLSFALTHIGKQAQLDYLAYYDELTGLANRRLFLERAQQKLVGAGATGRKAAIVVLDVERFRSINDVLGRHVGDELLRQIAGRMGRETGDDTRLARNGADQFGIVVVKVETEQQLARLLEQRLREVFGAPFRIASTEVQVSAKLGIAIFPTDGTDAEALLRNAEAALRKAKSAGEPYVFYAKQMTEHVAATLSLETKLRQALENDEFVLHYQPKADLETRGMVGMEALIRWQSPDRGLVPPAQFIPLLEETGLIVPVGAWALKRAALDHRAWSEAGLKPPRVAVNVSAVQLRQRDLVQSVEQAIRAGVVPTGIDLEITESLIMRDVVGTIVKLKEMNALGLRVAIDDFGTGYSSLAYLAQLPVEILKIDRSFVIRMLDDANTMSVVQAMISLAHALRLKVVAEGVETEEQAKMLRLLRCDQMQGYLFSKPLSLVDMTALLRSHAVPVPAMAT